MKVLFLNPPFKGKLSRTSRSPAVTRAGTIYYPFWLSYAAGLLEREGFNVSIIDSPAQGYTLKQTLEKISEKEPELIVIDTSTPSIYNDIKTAEQIKISLPDSYIVLVGTHPSALPFEILESSDKINAVAKGEYDFTVRDLARSLENEGNLEDIPGLVFRKNGKIIQNKARELIEDLDRLPLASEVYKKHLNIKSYFFGASDWPMVMIITGRGCPFRCFFCLYPQTFHSRRYRQRSAQNVVDEFQYIVKNLPYVKEIGIEDDTFTADRQRVGEICRLLIEKKIKIKWYCNVRSDLDLEIMRLMRKAGCVMFTVGFESGDQTILNNIRKGITVNQIKEFAKNAKKAGILVHGCFMFGNPGETKETMEKSLKLAKELNCDSMQFYPLIVYPGTEAYQWAQKNGYLLTTSYDKWLNNEGLYNCTLNLPDLTSKEIADFCERAFFEYYLRPRYVLMKIKELVLKPREIVRVFKSAKTFFKYVKNV